MVKTVLVTGGAYGIGRAISTIFQYDNNVAQTWCHREPDTAAQDNQLFLQADLTQEGSAERVIDATIARFGRIDVTVNNAGSLDSSPVGDFDADKQRAILDLNLLAPQSLLSAALPHLAPGAAIVSIPSVNAQLPPKAHATYGASKAGLNLWTRAMAKELGPKGIRVNAVAPVLSMSQKLRATQS
ncbi:SDR family NAD(P)-dependent oxidoreductase [Pseudophaeobacter sp.]|uniref:SDR family NAD(P)-dependent oxidoreductase n=1 Tax=Pseudophaeobacter sp. TaxID=1971739 RepID=UPI0032996DF7